MANIPIEKQAFNKKDFINVVNTKFNQLVLPTVIEEDIFTIEDFFNLYEQFFYQIQKEGDINSHKYILQKEAEYLGVNINEDDIQALINEITSLRQQVLDSQQIIKDLTIK